MESAEFDEITSVSERFPGSTVAEEFRIANEIFNDIVNYPTGEDIRQVHARVIVTDRELDGSGASEELLTSYLQYLEQLRSIDFDEEQWPGFEDDRIRISLISQMSINVGKRLAKTEKGYIGQVPSLTEVGDMVHILAGYKVPAILRLGGPHCAMRNDDAEGIDRTGMFRYVRQGYIHGIMKGEAMPLDFQRIQLY